MKNEKKLNATKETLAPTKIQALKAGKYAKELEVIPNTNKPVYGIFPVPSEAKTQVLAECTDLDFAEELVRRSNNHQELLDLCIAAEKFIQNATDTIQGFDAGGRRNRFGIEKELRAAIKKNGK